jgi:pilus assembly protein Flp/PilA
MSDLRSIAALGNHSHLHPDPAEFPATRVKQVNRIPEMKLIKKFFKDEEGATAIEYGLIAALIAVAAIAAMSSLGGNLSNTFNKVNDQMKTS